MADATRLIDDLVSAVLARSLGLPGSAEKLSAAKQAIRDALAAPWPFTGSSGPLCISDEDEQDASGVQASQPARPLPGVETLRNVIECLRAESRYVDEEGEATDRLQDLLDALRSDGVPGGHGDQGDNCG